MKKNTEKEKSVPCKQYNDVVSVFVPFFAKYAYFLNLYNIYILYFYFISCI